MSLFFLRSNKTSAGRLILAVVAVIAFGVAIVFWTHLILSATREMDGPQTSFAIQKIAPTDIRYVAVGDSYTVGTGVDSTQAWPYLLTQDLRAHGVKIGLVANLGVDGITTQGATDQEMPVFASAKPTFATLMIGVNDTYKPTTPDQFRAQVGALMDDMLKILPRKGRLLVITIPDYSVTPMGKMYAGLNDADAKIGEFNAILRQEAAKRHLPVVDVTPTSHAMGADADLIAPDGLHPSPQEYVLWEKLIFPQAYKMLSEKTGK